MWPSQCTGKSLGPLAILEQSSIEGQQSWVAAAQWWDLGLATFVSLESLSPHIPRAEPASLGVNVDYMHNAFASFSQPFGNCKCWLPLFWLGWMTASGRAVQRADKLGVGSFGRRSPRCYMSLETSTQEWVLGADFLTLNFGKSGYWSKGNELYRKSCLFHDRLKYTWVWAWTYFSCK